jgi:monoamine oxidase
LNKVVTKVSTRRDGATLTFADGATLAADHVLVTVPLGVLKSGSIAFDPPLPARKQQAVERLGMGLLNKHWLRFDKVFWPRDFDWHELLSERKGEWAQWVSLAKVKDMPVLMAFSAADQAEAVEKLSDRDIIASIMESAWQMFGSSAPDPVASQITRWRSDPFALGSYSFHAVGSGPDDRNALARSDSGRLHFAGEATQQHHPGTVHGALISGREAADRILQQA